MPLIFGQKRRKNEPQAHLFRASDFFNRSIYITQYFCTGCDRSATLREAALSADAPSGASIADCFAREIDKHHNKN
jgi:hypothetical protein